MCKKRFIFLVCFMFVTCFMTCFGSKQEELFLKANDLYMKQRYKKAFDLYKSIYKASYKTSNKKGYTKGSVVFYNMGNCAFKLERYVDAIIYWNKAKRGASFGQLGAIGSNIAAAYDKLTISRDAAFWLKITKYSKDYIHNVSLFVFQFWFLLFWLLLFVLFIFLKKYRTPMLIVVLCCTFVFLTLLCIKYRMVMYDEAIVKSSTALYSGPNEKYHQLVKLSIADNVVVQKVDKNWYKVKYGGFVGWALSDNIEII